MENSIISLSSDSLFLICNDLSGGSLSRQTNIAKRLLTYLLALKWRSYAQFLDCVFLFIYGIIYRSSMIKGVKLSQEKTMIKNHLGEGIKLDCDAIHSQVQFLQGKVLTVIDASTTGIQNKAMKDLIKVAFSDQLTYIRQLCYPEIRMMTGSEADSTIANIDEVIDSSELA